MARILVIDDDLDLLQMTRMILQRGGHEVILTGDGADGVAKAQQIHPELAIVDLMMPGMNGFQVVRKLRENPDTADIAILILTARAQPADRDAAMAANADAYLAKPLAPAELLQKIAELLVKRGQAMLPGHVMLSVLGLRGGVGTTTVAVNLALAMQRAGRAVCLVDLCEKCGNAAMQMRLKPQVTWADVLAQINSFSPETASRVLLQHESGLRLLPSPFLPVHQPPAGDAVARMLGVLRPAFGATIVDVSSLDEAGRTAISMSDFVVLLFLPEVASLQTTAATLRALKALNLPEDKVILVLNQVTPLPGLSTAAIEKALNRTLRVCLPYDEAQMQALGQGTPLVINQPDSALATVVRQLVQTLAPTRPPDGGTPKSS